MKAEYDLKWLYLNRQKLQQCYKNNVNFLIWTFKTCQNWNTWIF